MSSETETRCWCGHVRVHCCKGHLAKGSAVPGDLGIKLAMGSVGSSQTREGEGGNGTQQGGGKRNLLSKRTGCSARYKGPNQWAAEGVQKLHSQLGA